MRSHAFDESVFSGKKKKKSFISKPHLSLIISDILKHIMILDCELGENNIKMYYCYVFCKIPVTRKIFKYIRKVFRCCTELFSVDCPIYLGKTSLSYYLIFRLQDIARNCKI